MNTSAIVRAAKLKDVWVEEFEENDSEYFSLPSGHCVRVSNHARHRHHAATYYNADTDISVLVLTEREAEDYREACATDRFVTKAAVVIRKDRERAVVTARNLRKALADSLRTIR